MAEATTTAVGVATRLDAPSIRGVDTAPTADTSSKLHSQQGHPLSPTQVPDAVQSWWSVQLPMRKGVDSPSIVLQGKNGVDPPPATIRPLPELIPVLVRSTP